MVGKNARRIDDDAAVELVLPAVLDIKRPQAANHSRGFDEAGHLHVIDGRAAEVGERLREVDGEPGVIELAVVVNHPAAQRFGFDCWNALQGFGARQQLRRANSQTTGQRVVNLHSHAVERPFPPLIARHHERAVTHQMGRVPHQQSPLAQRFDDERHVALPQIPHAAVDQLCAAAGGRFGKVVLLQQNRPVTARSRFHRGAKSGGAAPDDNHVPKALCVVEPCQRSVAVHP